MSLQFTKNTVNIWFPNQVEPILDNSEEGTKLFREYWKQEKSRCIDGFYIADGQVFIPGRLYYHTVYGKIAAYVTNKSTNTKTRKIITPILRDLDWIIFNDLEDCEREGEFYALVGSRDFGKALLNCSTLYTDNGEILIQDVKVGDRIFGADGNLTNVTGVYPQGNIDIYKITLRDGRVLYCCDEHIWKVWNQKKHKWQELPLKEIKKDYLSERKTSYKNSKVIEYNYFIPNNLPVNYSKNYLPIDSYFLGLWLGDGNSRVPCITSTDPEIINYVTDYAILNNLSIRKENINYHLTGGMCGGKSNPILIKLRELELLENKHIPSCYIHSSIEQRINLLQGLMDTDGSCSKKGVIEYTTTSEKLANGFYQLVRSLGIQVSVKKSKGSYTKNGKKINTKDKYRFNLMTDKPVFKLKRKLERIGTYRGDKTSIVNIEYYGKEKATCITVDNDDKLFLTDNYTVTHNSIIAASVASHKYTFYAKSECVISSSGSDYIKLVTDKIEDYLINQHPILKKQRLSSDWKKEIVAGWKNKSTNQPDDRSSFSSIKVRNYEMGQKTMVANGTRPAFHLIDEIGTLPNFIGCIKDSDGCWWSGDGTKPSALVMYSGTGGDMEVGAEAAEVFFNPGAYNIRKFINTWEGGGFIGRFVPATMAKLEYKEPKTLSEYLGISHQDLDTITILVSNEERAKKEWWDVHYAKAVQAKNTKAMLKFKAHWPLKPSDSFIVLTSNDFDVQGAQQQEKRLLENEYKAEYVDLIDDSGKIKAIPTIWQPILEFPFKSDDAYLNHGCCIIYEHPIENAPYGIYVAGTDPYKQDKAKYSDSLGSTFIFKRFYDATNEVFQYAIVAEFCGRPEKMSEWRMITRNLLKYYNAIDNCENEDYDFIRWLIERNEGHMLQDQPSMLKEIIPTSNVDRAKGTHAAPKIIVFLNGLVRDYMMEPYKKSKDPITGEIVEYTNVRRIPSLGLLREIQQYNSKSGNYDRVRAFGLCLMQARIMDPIVGKTISIEEDSRIKSLHSTKRKSPSLFGKEITKLTKRRRGKLFT